MNINRFSRAIALLVSVYLMEGTEDQRIQNCTDF